MLLCCNLFADCLPFLFMHFCVATILQVNAMAKELEAIKRQNEVLVSAHERDLRVISEIGPEVHDLFVQLGCQDTHVPEVYSESYMTDRNLMRMLGLVDQQTALVMSVFGQLAEECDGDSAVLDRMKGNISGTKSFSSSLTKRTLAAKPAPPKIGDFDEDEEGSMNGFDESSSSSSSSSSDSSSDSESDDESERVSALSRKSGKTTSRKKKRKKRAKAVRGAKGRRSSGTQGQGQRGAKSAVQKPESISHLRKHIQRKVESGNHHHHHGSVIRFKPTSSNHFSKRSTFLPAAGTDARSGGSEPTGLGISADQLAALQSQHGTR